MSDIPAMQYYGVMRKEREKRICQDPSCGREFLYLNSPSRGPHRGRFCSAPCQRKSRNRDLAPTNWKGGRVKFGDRIGVWVPTDDPYAVMISHRRFRTGGYVLEHRLVMARAMGRPLLSSESVHHINGNPADNRLENLQLRIRHHGEGQAYCCADCGSRNIRPTAL